MDNARQLVLRYGWNSTAYQILNPGIHHWFSTKAPAVVGYVTRAESFVAAGAPICAPEALPIVTEEFERHAARNNRRVCYVGAAARLENFFHNSPIHSHVVIGAQPVWHPKSWPAILKSRPSLRAQLSRAKNKNITITMPPPTSARNDPALYRCLAEWLKSRPLPPMHFLVEPATLDGALADRLLLVAHKNQTPIAFLLASPVPERHGYLVEQIARSPAAPNGTTELLIDALMTSLANSGHHYLTMGLVPLARQTQKQSRQNPAWLRFLMAWARLHGQRFYHFDGLETFRHKMFPNYWETIYAISNEDHFTPASFHAMLAAFSDGPLPSMIARTLASALATEARWLTQKIFSTPKPNPQKSPLRPS